MSDSVKILYNGNDAFYPQPVPFIQLEDQTIFADERWGVAETLVLQGQITGCSFNSIVAAQNQIINNFNKSYQTIEIWQEIGGVSGRVFQKDLVEIQSISFNQDRMFGAQQYSITLACYPSGLFSGAFGILNPQDSWSFREEQNESLTAVHTISCQPFNTSSGPSNALNNARNWAFSKSGINSFTYPIMISGVDASQFCLLTQEENVDRFNGTYSLIETYTSDLARSGYGVIRYNSTIESGNNLITVSLQGTAEGCGQNINNIREAFSNLDKVAIATKQYQSVFNRTDLNPTPVFQSYNEDPLASTITFSYNFDNSNLPAVWFDYTVDLSVGTDGLITASIQGTVRARGGDLQNKLNRCKEYAATINLYNLVLPFYQNFDISAQISPLNPVPISNGQSNNETNGTVGLNATFDNRLQVNNSIFDKFEYTIEIVPSLAQVDAQPKLNGLGSWSVVNLNYATMARVTVNGIAVVNRNVAYNLGPPVIRQKALSLFVQYGSTSNAILDRDIITLNRNDNRVQSFSFSWLCGPVNIVGPTSVATLIV